jgi:hypothetical protein
MNEASCVISPRAGICAASQPSDTECLNHHVDPSMVRRDPAHLRYLWSFLGGSTSRTTALTCPLFVLPARLWTSRTRFQRFLTRSLRGVIRCTPQASKFKADCRSRDHMHDGSLGSLTSSRSLRIRAKEGNDVKQQMAKADNIGRFAPVGQSL